jgi:hypothetical protein
LFVGLAIVLAFLFVPVSAQSNTDDTPSAAETEALNNYDTATAAGRHAEAAKYVLDYMEKTEGENAPQTVALTHRYGNLLREEGDIREAVSVLKAARERGIIAYGEHGIELFQINLDLGDTYVDRNIGIGRPRKYFDDALEVLRENGRHETILYVRTLVGITSRLTQAGALEGALSADTGGLGLQSPGGDGFENLMNSGLSTLTHTYGSGYPVLEEYMREAVELAEVLDIDDGSVIAPRFPFSISSYIFRRLEAKRIDNWGPSQTEHEKKPQFVPVCINGRLMAVLINAPKVTIEEID